MSEDLNPSTGKLVATKVRYGEPWGRHHLYLVLLASTSGWRGGGGTGELGKWSISKLFPEERGLELHKGKTEWGGAHPNRLKKKKEENKASTEELNRAPSKPLGWIGRKDKDKDEKGGGPGLMECSWRSCIKAARRAKSLFPDKEVQRMIY